MKAVGRRGALIALAILLNLTLPCAILAGASSPSFVGGARIVRDAYGVPHIYADTPHDLFFAYGYVVAQDRLAQLDLYRRAAMGRLAEAMGASMLEVDEETLRELYTDAERRAQFQALPAAQREILEAYRDGINARTDEVLADPGLIPYDMQLLSIAPQHWDVADSIAIIQFLGRRFGEAGGAGGNELKNQSLYQDLVGRFGSGPGQAIFSDLVWLEDPDAPTTVPGAGVTAASPSALRSEMRVAEEVIQDIAGRLARVRALRESLGIPTRLGSYAWAVDAEHSATSYAMLFGGPQMGHAVPHVAHEIGLHGAGFDLVGMAFAGAPGVLIGHNGRVAWTATTGFGDQVDIYVELLDQSDRYRYWHDAGWHAMSCRDELIPVAGQESESAEICRTVHGPVLEWDTAQGTALSERRAHWGLELEAWLGMQRLGAARTVEEASSAAGAIPLSYNLIFADQAGDIGFRQAGKQPIRPIGFDPRLPVPGQGGAEWAGFLAPEQMPHVTNPPGGVLGNWNNKPAFGWQNGDAANWGVVDRVSRILTLLNEKQPATPADIKSIAYDIGRHDYRADALLGYLLNALAEDDPPSDARLSQAGSILTQWNHRGDEGEVGETLFEAWRTQVLADTFGDELGAHLTPLLDPVNPTGDSLLLRVLLADQASLPPARDYFNGTDPDKALIGSLISALDALTLRYGSANMSEWSFDPGRIDFKLGPLTIGSIPWSSRGSYMQFVELTTPLARGENILPPGQSGTVTLRPGGFVVFDPHFMDQLDLYRAWQFKPMPLRSLPAVGFLPTLRMGQ